MAWNLLLGSDFGLMSLGVIIGVIVIAAVLVMMFRSKIERSDRRRAESKQRHAQAAAQPAVEGAPAEES